MKQSIAISVEVEWYRPKGEEARVGRNKRSALRRIVFERRGHGEGSDRDPAGYGLAQAALRELV